MFLETWSYRIIQGVHKSHKHVFIVVRIDPLKKEVRFDLKLVTIQKHSYKIVWDLASVEPKMCELKATHFHNTKGAKLTSKTTIQREKTATKESESSLSDGTKPITERRLPVNTPYYIMHLYLLIN